eukprot:442460_1
MLNTTSYSEHEPIADETESSGDSETELEVASNENQYDQENNANTVHSNCSIKLVIIALICTASLGTISYHSLYSSLNLFLQKELNQSKAQASLHTALYLGTRYICTILGAIVSDQYLGRFKTTWLFMSIYFVGSVGVSAVAWIITDNYSINMQKIAAIFWFSIYLIAFGSGGVVPNLGTLGAEQVEQMDFTPKNKKYDKIPTKTDEQQKLHTYEESYFSWKYFGKNFGSLIAFTVFAYICQEISFGIGYTMPAIFSFLAIFCLVAPSRYYYVMKPSKQSVLKKFIKTTSYMICNYKKEESLSEMKVKQLQQDINDVNDVLKVLPILLCYIVYWSVYSQT